MSDVTMSQAELDAKVSDARTAGASEKEAEMKSDIELIKQESEARVQKTSTEAQKKVSEQSSELGELRTFKTDAEAKFTEYDKKIADFNSNSSSNAEAEAARKKQEAEAADPEKKLVGLKMTKEEASKLDELLSSAPEQVLADLKSDDPKKKAQVFLAGLEELRSVNGTDTSTSASAWLQGQVARDTGSPTSVRDVLKEHIKSKEKKANPVAGTPGGRVGIVGKRSDENTPSALKFVSMRDSAMIKKE